MSATMRLVLCLCLFPWSGFAQVGSPNVNLKDRWLISHEGKFVKATTTSTNTVFFWIDARKEKGGVLWLKGRHAFSIFINSKLVVQAKGEVKLSVDSLANIYSNQLFVGLYSSFGMHHLKSELQQSGQPPAVQEPILRKGNYFLDFTILASLLIVVGFTLLLRTNPTLTFDYLDVNKLFSFQDRDESTLALRIASSVNLLIYFFCSLFLALILLVSFHLMDDRVLIASKFAIRSTAHGFQQWFILSVIIFGLLIIKLVWLMVLNKLFGFRDIVRIQFFNFVRVILIAMTVLTLITVFYFVANVRDQNYFFQLFTILSIIFCGGAVVMYFKLMARMPYHFFHLFSYLCASEIMPLVVLIKVFFY
jgi:uncharacterized membrane protein YhdT